MHIEQPRTPSLLESIDINSLTENVIEFIKSLLETQNIYQSATKEISTKLEILNDEFHVTHKRNPIHQIQCRIKTPKSIMEKLVRKGSEIQLDSARNKLNDIAGVRVICPYVEDIYLVASLLERQDDITIIKKVDYIENPKENGYRSLHLVVKIPVFFSDRTEDVKVEIQIRTIAMDFWATLEHQIYYKVSSTIPKYISDELRECAEIIASTDLKMQSLQNKVEKLI